MIASPRQVPRPRIAVMFSMLGPYHVARLNALADVAEAVGIEGAASSEIYAWDKHADHDRFTRVTLFTDEPIARKSRHEIDVRVKAVLSQHRPDVVAVPGWAQSWGYAMLAWAQANGVPAIVMSESTRIDFERVWWREQLKRRILSSFSTAIVGGQRHVTYLEELGMARSRIFLGYNAVDNGYYAEGAALARSNAVVLRAKLGLPRRFFLASARFIEIKNLWRLIEAFGRYRAFAGEAAFDLVLLGDGELRPQLQAQIDALGLASAVQMPGFKQYGELPTYYGLASAFVHASTVEPWGLVVNEAASAGLPVIVSDRTGCVPELVADGENGFVFDPFDVGALAQAMARAASDGCDLAAMGRKSHERVAKIGPAAFGAGMLGAAKAALAAPKAPGPLNRMLIGAMRSRA